VILSVGCWLGDVGNLVSTSLRIGKCFINSLCTLHTFDAAHVVRIVNVANDIIVNVVHGLGFRMNLHSKTTMFSVNRCKG